MNILIKLTCLVGLTIAPILGEIYGAGVHSDKPTPIEQNDGLGLDLESTPEHKEDVLVF